MGWLRRGRQVLQGSASVRQAWHRSGTCAAGEAASSAQLALPHAWDGPSELPSPSRDLAALAQLDEGTVQRTVARIALAQAWAQRIEGSPERWRHFLQASRPPGGLRVEGVGFR